MGSDGEQPASTTVVLVTGVRYVVDGAPHATEATIVAASRGSILQLAWLTESDSGRPVAVNPRYVMALEPG